MKDNSLSEQLIRLAYAELILHHAEVDSPADFVENLSQDLAHKSEESAEMSSAEEEEPSPATEDSPDLKSSHWANLKHKLKSHKKLSIVALSLSILILPALFLLIWSNVAYKDKILPGTSYGNVQLSSDSDEALNQIKEAGSDFNFKLKFDEQEKTYSASEIGVELNSEETLNNAKKQSNQVGFLVRPFALFGSRNVQTAVKIDQEKLRAFLEAQNYSDKLPEDAKIEFNSDQSKFAVVPEVAGRGIDSKSFAVKLETSAKSLNTDVIDLKIESVTPDITQVSLQDSLGVANSFIAQKISITSPNKNYSPTPAIMKDWLTLTPDPANSTYQVSTNEKNQKDYIDGVTKKVNRKMEKKLYASINGSDLLLQQGTPGLQVSNSDAVKSQLINLFKAKKGGELVIEAKEEAPTTENVAASGGRWIFADLSQFRIYAYEGATLVNSFAMSSGKGSTPTPTGNYSVMSKVRVKTMTSGGNKNSKDYYSVPNIEWVAYFKAGGYAMHGVYWHNKFGVENTSHGCMGMSNASAQWVYNFVEVGTPVIVVA